DAAEHTFPRRSGVRGARVHRLRRAAVGVAARRDRKARPARRGFLAARRRRAVARSFAPRRCSHRLPRLSGGGRDRELAFAPAGRHDVRAVAATRSPDREALRPAHRRGTLTAARLRWSAGTLRAPPPSGSIEIAPPSAVRLV